MALDCKSVATKQRNLLQQPNLLQQNNAAPPEATRHGPPPEVEFIGNNEVRSLSDPGGPVVVG